MTQRHDLPTVGLFAPGHGGIVRASPAVSGDPPCRRDARPTSRAAARSMRRAAPTIRERVRQYITEQGTAGATAEQVATALDLRGSTAGARVTELAQAGTIKDSGRTRPTTSGRAAAVWIIAGTGGGDG